MQCWGTGGIQRVFRRGVVDGGEHLAFVFGCDVAGSADGRTGHGRFSLREKVAEWRSRWLARRNTPGSGTGADHNGAVQVDVDEVLGGRFRSPRK